MRPTYFSQTTPQANTMAVHFVAVDGGFSDWDEWTPCTAECGGGDQTRSRRCDNPAPQFGGLDCVGDFTECQRCNLDPCPSTCPA